MGYYKKLLKIDKIRQAIRDQKSKLLFEARIDYLISRNEDQYYKISDALEEDWYCKQLNNFDKNNIKGIIIFGCGHDGKRTLEILKNCNYFPDFFCDSDSKKIGTHVNNLEVLDANELPEKYRDYIVILGSAQYAKEMYQFLLSKHFPEEHILRPEHNILFAQCGNQYFDVFSIGEEKVFIDGGGYDGDTTLKFISLARENYKGIYIFEPIPKMFMYIKERIEKELIPKVNLYNNALWNKNESLYFVEDKAGSHIAEKGSMIIKGIILDDVVKDSEVTFIKMDVEGSELNALKGAKNTIIKNKPKLAICIYHKPEDILEIPIYLLELVPEYKFYIRHYSSRMWETVLYAEVLEYKRSC